jgi:hypothetical protein
MSEYFVSVRFLLLSENTKLWYTVNVGKYFHRIDNYTRTV